MGCWFAWGCTSLFWTGLFRGALDSRVLLDCGEAGQRRKVFGLKTVFS